MAKDRYEISLWEDYIVPATDTVPEHYEERKIAVIGSNVMTAYCRAIEPNLVENINGTNTFTFKMVYKCHNGNLDDLKYQFQVQPSQGEGAESLLDSQELQLIWSNLFFEDGVYDNPFIDLLVNERKIKVLWKDKWYDFVIKNYQKDSNGRTVTFTCKDLFINELSKNGYDLEFDTKLENNQGTVTELAQKVIEGTDWQLDVAGSDVIQQEKEEPVYESKVLRSFIATNETAGGSISIPINSNILLFYSVIQNIVDKIDKGDTTGYEYTQFLYASEYERENNSQLVLNGYCCSIDNARWEVENLQLGAKAIKFYVGSTNQFTVYYQAGVSSNYRAKRLVRSAQCVLDPLTGKYVNVYEATRTVSNICDQGDIIYGYRDTLFTDPISVNNLAVNGSNFTSLDGWLTNSSNFNLTLYPKYDKDTDITSYSARAYLKLEGGEVYVNTGSTELVRFLPEGFQIGEHYVLRVKVRRGDASGPNGSYYTTNILNPSIKAYDYENGSIVLGESYFKDASGNEPSVTRINGDWIEYDIYCTESITRSRILVDRVTLTFAPSGTSTYWLEEVEFFPYAEGLDENGNIVRINPKELNTQSVAAIRYNYYNHTKNEDLISVDDLNYIWRDRTDYPSPPFEQLYNEDFTKIRSITISKSNRFNILQTLAETFECWLEPYIEHTASGAFVYVNGVPQKFIRFKKERGIETGISFEYGIDLKTIQKTVQSDQIVTKTIVSNNNNQFAPNGFCSIARSDENYPKVNFILNFDYYINQGMIDAGVLYRDLYMAPLINEETGEVISDNIIGYYYLLHKYNTEYDQITEELTAKKTERDKQASYQTLYSELLRSTDQQIQTIQSNLMEIAGGVATFEEANDYINENKDSIEIKSRLVALTNLQNIFVENEQNEKSIEGVLDSLDEFIRQKENRQAELREAIKELDFKFYKKYSRFIQEGTWIDENYVDEDLYYLDAQDVAYTSAFPQVSYNVSVLRLSSLEEFKNKIFNVGDIAFIEDTDFFGYVYKNNVRTPYKEKVLIAEVSSFFDEPDKDSFKIQNYKTQFEDLFQRVNSATQTLKYNEGNYNKAASIVNTDGTITIETLQQTLNKATNLVYSSNSSVLQDSTGLTVVDVSSQQNMTKVTSGGLFISTDGGATWKNAVSAEGVALEYLTSGNINTNNINILDGQFPSFRWDSKGISAFEVSDAGTNFNKFVRLDHYGLYGINGIANYEPTSEDDIWRDASYGLTWKGFFLKSNYTNGYVSISSDNDFQVIQKIGNQDIERIKIGVIEFENDTPSKYGIKINNVEGDTVFETGSDGNISITGEITATSGHIGGMVVNDNNLIMDRIVIEPGIGIYANYPDDHTSDEGEGSPEGSGDQEVIETKEPLFLLSDEDGSAIFNNVTARGHIDARTGTLGDLDVLGTLTVGTDGDGSSSTTVIQINGETGTINSGNYESGVSGWSIESTGDAEFNDVTARGTIYATAGDLGDLTVSGQIEVGDVNGASVIIDGEDASIYSSNYTTQGTPAGWKINYDGSATFYDINAAGGTLGDLEVDGLLSVGSQNTSTININGQTGTISSSNYSSGVAGWQINSEGVAEFNNVTVRGTVYATDGSFTGTINANNGYLDGLMVKNTLTVGGSNQTGTIQSYATDNNNPMWSIDSNGLATFRNIQALGGTLGALNVIDTLTVGAQNAQGIIQSYNFSDGAGTGWKIDSNGDAIFNNITARGAIKTAVFEYAEIQAVGGIFLFRPSSTIKSASESGNDLVFVVEKAYLFSVDDWCKVSNYISNGEEPNATAALSNSGLTHVYRISAVSVDGKTVTLENAATPIKQITTLDKLKGGALVNMGKQDGSSNYGIGVNSSDNTVNLPRRAITLFETIINPSEDPKVTYDYKDILGTLPALGTKVSSIYTTYMEGTQGLFTDNIYLGNQNEYIAFYTANNTKKLDIVTNQLVVGSSGYLQSGNFVRGTNTKFAQSGTKIDLTNGEIYSPYFRLSQGGVDGLTAGAYVYGTISAIDGTIGHNGTNYWEIGDYTDYNLNDTAKIIGHGSSFIQLGDATTWRLATNRIHTGWYTDSDSLIHYPQIDLKYWDFGIHVPESDGLGSGRGQDKFIYIRSAKTTSTSLQNLLYDINDTYSSAQWDYKFWVDKAGNIHAQNFYIGDSTTPIGGGTGTVAEKLLSGAGSTTQPVYFPISGDNAGKPVAINYTIAKSVPSNAVFTDTTYTVATGTANGKIKVTPSSGSAYEVSVYGLKSAAYTESSAYATATQGTKADNAIPSSQKGVANGVATLDNDGLVPSSQLPSYVDDVLEYSSQSDFPATGESGKIYVAKDTNKTYRWSGTGYVEISPSLALGTTHSTAYYGDYGAAAYAHGVTNKGSAFASGLYKITTNSEGHVTAATAVVKADITALGIPAQDTTYTFDGTYNASTNKAATVSTVTNAINALDGGTIGTPGTGKTIIALSQTDGNISATFGNISITKSQVSDFPTLGAAAAKDVTDNSTNAYVTSTDTNLITGRTLYYHLAKAGYTTNTGTVTSVKVEGGSGLDGSGTVTTSGTITLSHADTSSQSSSSNTGRTYIQSVALDEFGHVTGLSTATETVTNTHYTTHLYVGKSSSTGNAATTATDDTYLLLFDDSTARESHKISGTNGLTISSTSSGDITFSSPIAFTNASVVTIDGKNYIRFTKSDGNTKDLDIEDITIIQAQGATKLVGTDASATPLTVSGPVKFSNGIPVTMLPTTSSGLFLMDDGTWGTPGGTYSLPLAANGTRGGVQIGYPESGTNYAVKLSSEKMYVTVPWTDTKLQVAEVTSGATYYPIVGTGTTAATRQYDTTGFIYKGTNGTTSTVGSAILTLGNSTSSGTANNKQGQLILYGTNTKKATITLAAPSADVALALPTSGGTLALTSQIKSVTQSATTGITASTTATKTTLGTASSIYGVSGTSTVTASKASGSNGSASNWVFEDVACDDITGWSAGSGSASISGTIDSTDNTMLVITISHTHTAPTLTYTAKTASHVKSGGNGTAPTWSFTDVTVPVRNGSATSVPNVSVASATVSIIEPTSGHTHNI